MPAPHDPAVQHGVPIQPSASSHSTNASQQPQKAPNPAAAHAPDAGTLNGTSATPNLVDGQTLIRAQLSSHTQQTPQPQLPLGPPQRSSTPPTAAKMLPAYAQSVGDDRARLMREAAQRDAQLLREREKELELDRERLRKEEKRARRAERDRQKEAERSERARLEELERVERERQREQERREKERVKAAERAERERQKEMERQERERLREKEREKERERERQYKAATRTRSHRNDKAQSTPVPLTSVSDAERLYRQTVRFY